MASIIDLLSKTMLFTADAGLAFGAAKKTYGTKKTKDDPITCPTPTFTTPAGAIWHWTHDPDAPAKIGALTALVLPPKADGSADTSASAMTMPVCDRIEALSVKVRTNFVTKDGIDLPLTKKYVVAKFFLPSGHVQGVIPAGTGGSTNPIVPKGWWRLESNVDASILVVFAYEIVSPTGDDPPLTVELEDLEADTAFPDADVGQDDPDYIGPLEKSSIPAAGSPGAQKAVETTVTAVPPRFFVLVAFGLTTCKERADFEPGGVLGAGRVYPHVMVLSSRGVAQVEAKLAVDRPAAEAMKHDPEMMDKIGPLLVTDTNEQRNLFSFAPFPPPLPVWSNFFDYWDASPPTNKEFKVVDWSLGQRTVSGAIQRERSSATMRALSGIYESSSDFVKFAGQGEWDNLHMAPRMKFTSTVQNGSPTIQNIVMAPFCVHDCFHTHFRWGTLAGSLPMSNKGFSGRTPYATDGAPLVPADQVVFLKLTSSAANVGFEYRAVQGGTIRPSTWSVFCHHGSAYAIEVTSPFLVGLARTGVQELVKHFDEPFTSLLTSPMSDQSVTVIDDVKPIDSWAAFYQRLQFTGEAPKTQWMPRINILNLEKCRSG